MFRKLESHFFIGVTKQGLIYFFHFFSCLVGGASPLKKEGAILVFCFCCYFVFSFHPRIPPREGKILSTPVIFTREGHCFMRICFFSEIFQRNLFQKDFCFSWKVQGDLSQGEFLFFNWKVQGDLSKKDFFFHFFSP